MILCSLAFLWAALFLCMTCVLTFLSMMENAFFSSSSPFFLSFTESTLAIAARIFERAIRLRRLAFLEERILLASDLCWGMHLLLLDVGAKCICRGRHSQTPLPLLPAHAGSFTKTR
jgi:hypothetical protein